MIPEEKKDHSIRLKKVVQYSKMSNRSFGMLIGHSNGTIINNVINGRNGVSVKLANEVCKKLPEISYAWLLAGEGEMLLKKEEPKDELVKKIETLEEIIKGHSARLAVVESYLSKRV